MVNIQEIIGLITKMAPQRLAYDWDNSGLQIGNYSQMIERVLLTLDVTEEVLEESVIKNCQFIISHHPLIFKGIKNIHTQNKLGRIIFYAIKNNISIFSVHTNFDIANNGMNDYLAKLLGIIDTYPIDITEQKKYYKFVVFVPEEYYEKVSDVIFSSGAGHIGNYSHASFSTKGESTFKPLPGSMPFKGKIGELRIENERRVETIVPAEIINKLIKKVLKVHPYEEVAYDVFPLENEGEKIGLGRIGRLSEKIKLIDYIEIIKDKLNLSMVKFVGNKNSVILKVAVCGGSGADLIRKAKRSGADLFITSDIKYHESQMAEEIGLNLIDAGHYETEVIFKDLLEKYLNEQAHYSNLNVEFIKSELNTNPWEYY
jgi:dinuclear metal center YbgI/SA1388 family protein